MLGSYGTTVSLTSSMLVVEEFNFNQILFNLIIDKLETSVLLLTFFISNIIWSQLLVQPVLPEYIYTKRLIWNNTQTWRGTEYENLTIFQYIWGRWLPNNDCHRNSWQLGFIRTSSAMVLGNWSPIKFGNCLFTKVWYCLLVKLVWEKHKKED